MKKTGYANKYMNYSNPTHALPSAKAGTQPISKAGRNPQVQAGAEREFPKDMLAQLICSVVMIRRVSGLEIGSEPQGYN